MADDGATLKLTVSDVVGGGYDEFWCYKGRYRVVKGSRNSKKSATTALNLIVRLVQYPLANILVVRQYGAENKDSTYVKLKWAIDRLGLSQYFLFRVSPLEIEYKPTGQKILFRGLDDELKVTSIDVAKGILCWGWVEEAYEIDESSFDTLDESLRGKLPDGYFIQWTLTFNPWSECWLKDRFFDAKPSPDILAITTTYKCNEFISETDLRYFKKLKETNKERYRVAGLGEWGVIGGRFFDCWDKEIHVCQPFEIPKTWMRFRAMDWGSFHPYCVLWFAIDQDNNLWVYRELYGWGGKANVGTKETAKQVGEKIAALEKPSENVTYGVLDSACWANTGVTGPTVAEEINDVLNRHRLVTFSKSSKGRVEGANIIRERLVGRTNAAGIRIPALVFFANCIHTIRTLPTLTHDKNKPETYDTTGEDHCLVAGTLIETDAGEVPIEDIKAGDMVLTRKGYRRVLAAGLTGKNKRVITTVFDNGATLTGTVNHPIFVKNKNCFVPMGELERFDEAIALCQKSKQIQQKASCSTASPSGDTRCLNGCQTENILEQAAVIENRESTICTSRFGNPTMEKCRTVITSTTRTETPATTTLKTSNCCQHITILPITARNTIKGIKKKNLRSLKKSGLWHRSGTPRKQDTNGTSITEKLSQKKCVACQECESFAPFAEKSLKFNTLTQDEQNFVPTNALQNIDATAELTTKNAPVLSVDIPLESIATQKQKLAAVSVAQTLCLKHETALSEVYNLTVEDEPEYFANGILVHNCVDACAYGCMSRPFSNYIEEKPRKKRDKYRREKKRSVWTV